MIARERTVGGRFARMTLRGRMVAGMAWSGAARWIGLGSGMVSMAVLARFLAPADFAVTVAAGALAGFVGIVQESGLAAAVIHHRGDDDRVASTALGMHLAGATLCFAVCVAVSPWLAAFFHIEQRAALAAAFAPIWLAAWTIVPTARLDKALAFKRSALVQVVPALVYPAVAIPLAVRGAGAWALVLGQIAAGVGAASAAWVLVPTRFRWSDVDWGTGRRLAAYGRPILGSNLLGRLNDEVDNWVTGRLLGPAALGLYAMAFRLATLPRTGVTFVVSSVLFPALAIIQEDRARLAQVFLRALHWVAVVTIPASVGLAVLAPDLVGVVLGPRWEGAVAPTRVLAGFALLASLSATTGDVFKATGRSEMIWRIGLVHSLALWSGLALFAWRGLPFVALAVTLATAVSATTAFGFATGILDLPRVAIARALFAPASASALMALALLAAPGLPLGGAAALLGTRVVLGAAVYAVTLAALAPGDVRELGTMLAGVRLPRRVRVAHSA